ncbi:hypothetical protein BDC45DRAFT_575248 [Circinella umbellata]|nr:hypothetical protein BDC45DRAFT_575248 [Circinella umbellata]
MYTTFDRIRSSEAFSLPRSTSVATVISPSAAVESLDSNNSHRNDLTDNNDNEEDEILVLDDGFFGSEESAKKKATKEYDAGTYWVTPKMSSFALENVVLGPKKLYYPRVFLWYIPSLSCGDSKSAMSLRTANPRLKEKILTFFNMTIRIIKYTVAAFGLCLLGTSACRKSFSGFNKEFFRQLPLRIQADFSAHSTHKSGVSRDLGNLLRSCIQNGTGTERFLDNRQKQQKQQMTIMAALKMMILGGEILKGDHSFKIIKNMESLNHLAPQFDAMMKSYDYYGHSEVKAFFTDNVK